MFIWLLFPQQTLLKHSPSMHTSIDLIAGLPHLQVADNAEALWPLHAACGGSGQLVRTADQQVSSSGIAAALGANVPKLRELRDGSTPENCA